MNCGNEKTMTSCRNQEALSVRGCGRSVSVNAYGFLQGWQMHEASFQPDPWGACRILPIDSYLS